MALVKVKFFIQLQQVVTVAEKAHDILAVATADEIKQSVPVEGTQLFQKRRVVPGDGLEERAADMDVARNLVAGVGLQDPPEAAAIVVGSENGGRRVSVP